MNERWRRAGASLLVPPQALWRGIKNTRRLIASHPDRSLNVLQAGIAAFAGWVAYQAAVASWETVKESRKQFDAQQRAAEADRRTRRPYFRVAAKRLEDTPGGPWIFRSRPLHFGGEPLTLPPGQEKQLTVELLNLGPSPAAAFHADIGVHLDASRADGASPAPADSVPEMVCPMFSRGQDVAPGDTVLLSCPVFLPSHTLVDVRVYYVDAFTADPAKEQIELCQFFGFQLRADGTVADAGLVAALNMVKWKDDSPCGPRMPDWFRRRLVTPPPPTASHPPVK